MKDAEISNVAQELSKYGDYNIRIVNWGTYNGPEFVAEPKINNSQHDASLLAEAKENSCFLASDLLSKRINTIHNDRKTYAFMILTHYCDQNNINLPINVIKNIAELTSL